MVSRRSLLGAGLASLGAGGLSASPLQVGSVLGNKRPKNVIFCVVDGMASQTFSLADEFQKRVYAKGSYWAGLMNEPYAVNGLQYVGSLTGVVTDSAAASAAWGSGVHVWNGALNELPDGTKLRTLTSLVSEKGVRCGLVTTTTMTHATPAGFAICSATRGAEPTIAELYLNSGVDILMGGGDRYFSASRRADKKDVYGEFVKAGFKVVKTRDEALGATSGKVLGIFGDSHLPFMVDQNNDAELQKSVPTLAEMTRLALANLKGSPKGFLLQIEGGKVDHGAHANDLAGMFYDQIAFEEAVKVAVDFALADGETLVIITADHACGGPSLNGAGEEYIDATAGLESIAKMKASYYPLTQAMGKTPNRAQVQDVHKELLGMELTADEADVLVATIGGNSPFKVSEFYGSLNGTMAVIHGNHSKVTWTSGNHTAEHVMVTAVGPGSALVHGITENIRFFDLMTGVFGVSHTNPTMSHDEARRLISAKALEASTVDEHWV